MNADQLVEDLKSDEGWVPHVYKDSLGYWTIGYGFLVDKQKGGRLPRKVADFWLRLEVEERYEKLKEEIPWITEHPEPVQRALVNMSYQMGIKGVLGFHNTLRLIQKRLYAKAAVSAMASKWATQTSNRAERVTSLIASGGS